MSDAYVRNSQHSSTLTSVPFSRTFDIGSAEAIKKLVEFRTVVPVTIGDKSDGVKADFAPYNPSSETGDRSWGLARRGEERFHPTR